MWEVKFSTLPQKRNFKFTGTGSKVTSRDTRKLDTPFPVPKTRKPANTCKHTIQLDESVRFLGLKCPTLPMPMVCDAHSPNPANINSRVCIMSRLACSITPQAGSPPAPFNATLSMLGSRILAT